MDLCSIQQANSKFNDMLTMNSKLREEIDSLRVERTRFENIRKKLDKVFNFFFFF